MLAPGAVVAVIKAEKMVNPGLQALTAAALMLPGLVNSTANAADGDEFNFQYGRYEESARDLNGVKSQYKPITVDSLHSGGKVNLTDRIKFAFNFIQDTWSGATPITTAPSGRQGNQPYRQFGTVAGASPYIQTGGDGIETNTVYFDRDLKPLLVDPDSLFSDVTSLGQDRKLVHTMSTASPETRKEGNFKLSYEWDEAAVDIGGGISVEHDYESRFGNAGVRLDFNQKRTTLNAGLSYTNSDSFARLSDHFTKPYLNYIAYQSQLKPVTKDQSGDTQILGKRDDWGGNLGLTQVVNKDALFKLGIGFTHSQGYLENPYKAVTAFFIQPVGLPSLGEFSSTIPFVGIGKAFLEQRPDYRNQWIFSTGWVQHINPLDAAFHFDYRFFHDDWGINAHTFEGDWVQPLGAGWSITPRVRYYSQSAADFYHPYLIVGPSADPGNANLASDNAKLPSAFSSDHRLSGYGALSGGIMLSKQFSKGIRLDAGFEYYTHQGDLKLGGGGEADYADFNYYVANATLNVNLTTLGRSLADDPHAHHRHHSHHHGAPLPAGLMFGHVMSTPGDVMVGYRYMYSRQDGDMLYAGKTVSDRAIVDNGCIENGGTCRTVPEFMNMHMHMLDIMYAATDWLNLMVMPQFMDMDMNARPLSGITPAASGAVDHLHGGHDTGAVGDTGMYALVKLFQTEGHQINMGLGVTAPTGKVDIKLNRMHKFDSGYIHYGMQLGSGTWDFKPSLTYTGQASDWSWGAQVSGTKRLEARNSVGFALGDAVQSTAWGSYNVLDWLAASVRGIYTAQGAIKGGFQALPGDCAINYNQNVVQPCVDINPKGGSMDNPKNYGGHYWDVGFGLNAMIPDGAFAGHNFSVEWLQPVEDNVNGYQLERSGTLNATWMYAF
ncbi:DUF3570 domain-containing protein [Methylomonas sp. SURF-1]|uniref:DUF3570 domain-containing protein n=1 Tax=Methylomonas aurea TaxID=2952224 RepID=A0ABT1UMU5_9GAMM|nr:DUF3570 domain-containing protein [Methylomonas sp. SURF-1]MCQ8183432.1 DUF3570 domain-containing protein [Methylomonas sp. SURF-1]